jgi:hypothetical protein
MAKVLIEYEGNVDGLKAAVAEVTKANEQISDSAKQSSAEVTAEYKKVAAAGKAAFASEETKKAIDSQVSSVNTLKTQLEKLYQEEVQLLSSGKGLTEQYKKNREEAARVRSEFDKLTSSINNETKAEDKAVVASKKLTTQLRDLKQQLSLLEQEGKSNTKEFQNLAVSAAKLEDQIGDTRERVKALSSDTFVFDAAIDSVSALAGGFAIAEGAVGLFAEGNEEVQAAIAKTNSLMAILNGLQQVQAFFTGQSAGKLAILNIAQRAYSIAVGTSTGALKVFRLALIGTGIGALVVALGFLATNFEKVKQAAYNLIPGLKEVGEFIGSVIDKTKELLGLDGAEEDLGVIGRLIARQDRALQAQVKSLDRQIELQKEFGKNTTALEIEREQAQLKVLSQRLAFIKANEQILSNSIDTETKIFELEQEIADRRNTIQVLGIKERSKNNKELEKLEQERLKARERLNALETEAFVSQLGQREKILNESNIKIAELEKAFRESKFKQGSDEEIQQQKELADAIATIKIQANKQIAEIEKEEQAKLLAARLEAAKASEDATLQQQIIALEAQKKIVLDSTTLTEQEKLKIITGFNKEIKDLNNDIITADLNAQVNAVKTLEAELGSSLARRIELINLEAKARIKAATDSIKDETERTSAIELINAETAKAIRDANEEAAAERKKKREEEIDEILAYAGAFASALNSIAELQRAQSEQRIADVERVRDAELEANATSQRSYAERVRNEEAINLRANRKIVEEKRKQAKLDKALGIFNAVISTAQAVANALKTAPPLGFILAAAAGIAGGVQIAKIASEPLPKFKRGGWINGSSHEAGGVAIEAEGGEYVTRKGVAKSHKAELEAMNTSKAAFMRVIEERYVRPRLMAAMMNNKRNDMNVNVNASLRSEKMEGQLVALRKETRNTGKVISKAINGGLSSRYHW